MTYHYTQVQLANLKSTNNFTGSDNINISYLKHLRPFANRYHISMYNIALNTNTIFYFWKHSTIIPISKPKKDHNVGTILSPLAKTLEKTLLSYITKNILTISHQHGLKHKHSTHTALHNICLQITWGFNNPRPPQYTITVALDMKRHLITNKHS